MALGESLYFGKKLYEINAQPTYFHRSFFETWIEPPHDFSLDLYAYIMALEHGCQPMRFPVSFPKRPFGLSHWNTSLGAKWKFIKRTVKFSRELHKKIHITSLYRNLLFWIGYPLLTKGWSYIGRCFFSLQNPHPSSAPFISGDTFRSLADHRIDTLSDVSSVLPLLKPHDLLFVASTILPTFIKTFWPQITVPVRLMTHNGDTNIDETYLSLLDDDRCELWWAQNALIKHPKLHPIPIGLENAWRFYHGAPFFFRLAQRLAPPHIPRILYRFNENTNPTKRLSALKALQHCPIADTISGFPTPPRYLAILRPYFFVASPEGNGADCHRTWEAMTLGIIPIVIRTPMTQAFYDLGLPLCLIEDWSEVIAWTEQTAQDLYKALSPRFSSPFLTFEAWKTITQK
jgi:hypothetical protein